MELGLAGKVALVAASSKGLGRAVAEELASEGARVMMCARGADALADAHTKVASRARSADDVASVVADVATMDGVARVTDEAMRRFGRVDIVVTNGGGPPPGKFDAHGWDAWQSAVDLVLRSAVELTRAVLPGMRERKWGRVLNVTSIAVKQPVDDLVLSNSLRSAVTGWARSLANEVATDGVTVNNILPGYTRTDRVVDLAASAAKTRGISEQQATALWENQIPMRRLGEPREFAALAAFLASDRASYITGQSIAVDGGWIRALF